MTFLVSCLWGIFISSLKDASNHMDYSIERYKQFLAFRSSFRSCFKYFIPLSLNSESVSIYFVEFNSAKEDRLVTCQFVYECRICYQKGGFCSFSLKTCRMSIQIILVCDITSLSVCVPSQQTWIVGHHCPRVWAVLWLESEASLLGAHALNSWSSASSVLLRDRRTAARWGLTGRVAVGFLEEAFEAFPPYLALCFMASTMLPTSAVGSYVMNCTVRLCLPAVIDLDEISWNQEPKSIISCISHFCRVDWSNTKGT